MSDYWQVWWILSWIVFVLALCAIAERLEAHRERVEDPLPTIDPSMLPKEE